MSRLFSFSSMNFLTHLFVCLFCAGESSEYVISLKAFNNVGDGRPVYETTQTQEQTSEMSVPTIRDMILLLQYVYYIDRMPTTA